MMLSAIRKRLGPKSTKADPCMNARDLFESALEEEIKNFPGKDVVQRKSPTARVIEWFGEGYDAAFGMGPETIPLAWAATFRSERLTAMLAGVLHRHNAGVDSMEMIVRRY